MSKPSQETIVALPVSETGPTNADIFDQTEIIDLKKSQKNEMNYKTLVNEMTWNRLDV